MIVALAGCSSGPAATWCDDVESIVQGVGVLTGASPLLDGTYAELRAQMAAAAARAQDGPTDAASLAARAVAESLTTAASRVDRPDFDPQDRSRPTLAVLSELTRTAATLAGQYAVNCRDSAPTAARSETFASRASTGGLSRYNTAKG